MVIEVTFSSVSVSVKLDNFGCVFAVSVPKEQDLGRPKPFQIARGLNNQNFPQQANSTAISLKFTSFLLEVDGLQPQTEYRLYLTAGSAHPGSPDLMDDSYTFVLDFMTLIAPKGLFSSAKA